jgi:hypothetical protein
VLAVVACGHGAHVVQIEEKVADFYLEGSRKLTSSAASELLGEPVRRVRSARAGISTATINGPKQPGARTRTASCRVDKLSIHRWDTVAKSPKCALDRTHKKICVYDMVEPDEVVTPDRTVPIESSLAIPELADVHDLGELFVPTRLCGYRNDGLVHRGPLEIP